MTKLAYERPVMRAEAFEADNYIAACRGPNPIVEESIQISKNNKWYFSTLDWAWGNAVTGNAVTEKLNGYDIEHTFNPTDNKVNRRGTKYWYTDGDDGDGGKYFLEYSERYSQKTDTFFLYKDTSNGYGGAPNNELETTVFLDWPNGGGVFDRVLGIVCPILNKKVTNS